MSEVEITVMPEYQASADTLPLTTSVFLKYEATPATRVQIPAEKGTKIGALVPYALANGTYFVALSDEKDGLVMIQPLNCVMDTRQISDEAINGAGGYVMLMQSWLPYGVAVDGADSRQPTPIQVKNTVGTLGALVVGESSEIQ